MVIVETEKEFVKFSREFHDYDSIVIPIQCDENKHPMDTKLCLLYIKMLDGDLKECVNNISRLQKLVTNENFIAKANPDVVNNEIEKLRASEAQKDRLEQIVAQLKG